MISVITPLLVTYVIAVVSIYMGSQELPPIRNNLKVCHLRFIFPKKKISDSDSDIWHILNQYLAMNNTIKTIVIVSVVVAKFVIEHQICQIYNF